MARRSKRKYYRKSETYDPVLSRGIISVILVVAALLITLSFFGSAGTVGIFLDTYLLSSLFGVIRYTTPIILLVLAWFLVRETEYEYRMTHKIGTALFFLSAASLFHMGFAVDEMWQAALDGRGGGFFGMGAWVMKTYLGMVGGVLVLIGLVIVSVLLIFNTAIAHFVLLHRKLFAGLGFVGKGMTGMVSQLFVRQGAEDEYYDDEDEEYDDEDDDEEDRPAKRGFFSKQIGEEEEDEEEFDEGEEEEDDDEDEEDEDESEEETPQPKEPVKNAPGDGAPTGASYMENVIIKKVPAMSLLTAKRGKPSSGDIKENAKIIKDTFKEFKIQVKVESVRTGPSVTQYALKPEKGVKLSRITSLSNNLALSLAAHPIRIEAPIPGKSLVGIEVPNEKIARVTLKELLQSEEFKDRDHNMMLALGKDVAGKTWFANLPRLPHLLIAGATGSGKTVCVNTILLSLLYQNTAETLRMILVDPKRVEMTPYNGIPHLLTPVITNVNKTVNALKWTIGEMDRRFEVLAASGNRNLDTYNAKHPNQKMPHIIFVIDELADLMATAANQVEAGIIRLAQMARAVGIHLILATQRPSVDVITGLMKANIPGRIAFSVASLTDSRTILDSPGAEKLLGRGDMLLQTAELSKPVRIQGAFVSEQELSNIIGYLRGKEKPTYDDSIVEKGGGSGGTMNMFGGPSDDKDELFEAAKQAILEAGKASASFLQRKLKVGYARAARILDELEEAGIIGPADGAKPREILVTETVVGEVGNTGGELNVFDQTPPAEEELDEEELEDLDEDFEDEEEDESDDEEYEEEDDEGEDEEEEEYEDDDDEDEEYTEDEEDEEYDDEEEDEEELEEEEDEEEDEDDDFEEDVYFDEEEEEK